MTELNRNQKVALNQIRWCMRWEIGGIENEILDGNRSEMPSLEDSVMLVYEGITTATYAQGECMASRPIKEIKFCTKDWLIDNIKIEIMNEYPYYRNEKWGVK